MAGQHRRGPYNTRPVTDVVDDGVPPSPPNRLPIQPETRLRVPRTTAAFVEKSLKARPIHAVVIRTRGRAGAPEPPHHQ